MNVRQQFLLERDAWDLLLRAKSRIIDILSPAQYMINDSLLAVEVELNEVYKNVVTGCMGLDDLSQVCDKWVSTVEETLCGKKEL